MAIWKSRFRSTLPAAQARCRRTRQKFATKQREVLEAVGVRVLSLSKQAYVVKSRGGRGSDGIDWKKLDDDTVKRKNRRGKRNAKRKTTRSGKARPGMNQSAIGIDTGLQLNSASPGFTAAGGGNLFELTSTTVTVGYARSYSKYFDRIRKLMPTKLPATWRKECDAIVRRWAAKIMKELTNG